MSADATTWRPVVGYEGRYEVSDAGEIRSLPRLWILKPSKNRGGYLQVVLCDYPRARSTQIVHTVVAAAFLGPRQNGLQVNHVSGVKTDNRACNLEYVTPSENVLHIYRNGLRKKRPGGSMCAMAKLSHDQVREIRIQLEKRNGRRDRTEFTYAQIAKPYGVGRTAISSIAKGLSFKDVT